VIRRRNSVEVAELETSQQDRTTAPENRIPESTGVQNRQESRIDSTPRLLPNAAMFG
jgi:hypothetical protein